MKINKKLIIVSIFLISILAAGATLVYSAKLNDAKSSLIQEVMNPFDFFKQCRAIGGLVFAWDNGYGCDFLDNYDVICDNGGVCGEGFVAEIDPQNIETDIQNTEVISQNDDVTGTIFDVGLHTDSSTEQFSSDIQNNPQTGDAGRKKEKTSDDTQDPASGDSHQSLKEYCISKGGTYFEENDGRGCDLPGEDDDIFCSNSAPCEIPEPELADASNLTSFGALTPVDANNKYLFVNKPGSTQVSFLIKSDNNQISPLAGSNQLYSSLEEEGEEGDSTNIGIFRLKSKWGVHEYEGLIFPISRLAYLLPESPEEPPESEIVEQIEQVVDPQPTEPAILTVTPKQDMNCRCGAGTHTDYYTTFRVDSVATVLGKNEAGDWYFVELEGGAHCWIWGDGLQDTLQLDNIPIPDSASIELGKACSTNNDSKERGSNEDGIPNTGGGVGDNTGGNSDGGGGGGGGGDDDVGVDPFQPPACVGCDGVVDPGGGISGGGDSGGVTCGNSNDDVCVGP